VFPDQFHKELNICGTKSGRDINKLAACNFQVEKCIKAESYFTSNASFHFECRIVHKHLLDPGSLDPSIIKRYYPQKDFHMVYYGEILGIFGGNI